MSFICPTSIQSRSLWIGEIENWMDEKYISNNFLHYGYRVKSVKIIRDKNTKTVVGYGFVEFITPEIAKEVLQNLNGKLIPNSQKTFKLNSATYSAGIQRHIQQGKWQVWEIFRVGKNLKYNYKIKFRK